MNLLLLVVMGTLVGVEGTNGTNQSAPQALTEEEAKEASVDWIKLSISTMEIGQSNDHYCDGGSYANLCDPDMYIWMSDVAARQGAKQHELWETPGFSVVVKDKREKFQDAKWTDLVTFDDWKSTANVWTFSSHTTNGGHSHDHDSSEHLPSNTKLSNLASLKLNFDMFDSDRGYSYSDIIRKGGKFQLIPSNNNETIPKNGTKYEFSDNSLGADSVATSIKIEYTLTYGLTQSAANPPPPATNN